MSERLLRVLVAVLALAGVAIAAYLSYSKLSGNPPICPTSGCEVVQNSRWSKLVGIPIAVLGMMAYLTIFASTVVRHELARLAGVTVVIAALGFNGYLFYIMRYEIGRYCTWCVVNEVVSVILVPVAIAWLVVGSREDAKGAPGS